MEASATVEELLGLQELDFQIDDLSDQLSGLHVEVEERQAVMEDLELKTESARKRLELAEEELRRLQRSVQAGRATLKRLEGRAQGVTNMDQHLAVRVETDTARRNLRLAEEEALETMAEVEQAGSDMGELEASLVEATAGYEAKHAEAEASRTRLQDEIATRRDQRRNRELRIEARFLRLYQNVASGRTASALAPLTADGVCGHCYTSVPLQRQSDIRSGADLAVCEGCGVILYAGD